MFAWTPGQRLRASTRAAHSAGLLADVRQDQPRGSDFYLPLGRLCVWHLAGPHWLLINLMG